ncbi:hypothetical protein [Yoonia sp. 208BN28-4]|uniref:hypothetical protein n=1 Tax=Yoonia sp. 208BN28-4 TaxID=3126505 RepID=UPI0030B65DD1
MAFIADILLVAGALGAGFYCHVLSSRLRRFTDLEKGVGGAVAVLSAQVDDLATTLAQSRQAADGPLRDLRQATDRAEGASRQIELLLASLHDLPPTQTKQEPLNPFFVRRPAEQADRA